MKLTYKITGAIALFLVSGIIISATKTFEKFTYNNVNEKSNSLGSDEEPIAISLKDNITYAVHLPDRLSFAEEQVPLDKMDVRERLDRELTVNCFWQSSTILMLKRGYRYLDLIENILRKNDVPVDFKYLALAESGLQDNVSPSGAAGFWQFMNGTAKDLGLTVNEEIDERYHIEKATQAACDYLKKIKAQFGSWTLAAAAYNMGQNGLQNQLDRQQESNYYDLILSDETSRYIFRILALKAIFSAPTDFGFHLTTADLYQPYKYKVSIINSKIDSWPEFCKQNNITYRELKLLNPWLRDIKLTNAENREYKIKIVDK